MENDATQTTWLVDDYPTIDALARVLAHFAKQRLDVEPITSARGNLSKGTICIMNQKTFGVVSRFEVTTSGTQIGITAA